MDAVVARGLRRSYGSVVAVDDVDLTVEAGRVVGLIGPNGAGKTTLVRCLTGTAEPDSGTVRLLGAPPSAVRRERLGLLPQSFDPPGRLSARELVGYYAGLYEAPRDPDAVLSDVGVAADRDTWYEDLSGGQRRRVAVATALVNDPDVLFLDEPTTGIDPAGRRAVWRLVERLRDGGTTVVLTTHDMAEAARLADRVVLLADGAVVADGPPGDLVAEHGGASQLRVRTATPTDPETVTIEGHTVRATGDGLVVTDVAVTEVGAVVEHLLAAGVTPETVRWAEPDLEDVYLRLADDGPATGADGRSGRAAERATGTGTGPGRPR